MPTRRKSSQTIALTTGSFVSLGLVCTLLSTAGNYAVTTFRVGALEAAVGELGKHQQEQSSDLAHAKLEYSTELAVLKADLSHMAETLARIEGRLSSPEQKH